MILKTLKQHHMLKICSKFSSELLLCSALKYPCNFVLQHRNASFINQGSTKIYEHMLNRAKILKYDKLFVLVSNLMCFGFLVVFHVCLKHSIVTLCFRQSAKAMHWSCCHIICFQIYSCYNIIYTQNFDFQAATCFVIANYTNLYFFT